MPRPIDLIARAQALEPFPSLEELLTSRDGFGLTTASNLQRATCRVVEGLPLGELWDDPDVRAAFHDVPPANDGYQEICILSGTRTGKTLWAGACAVYATQTCDVSSIREAGEIPRVSLVSVRIDNTGAIYNHILGSIQKSPVLSKLIVGEPKGRSIMMRHPSGKLIEILVVAGTRTGSSLVSRWSAGVIFDEAPRMLGEDDGAVVNLDEQRSAVVSRLLNGAKLLHVGSPWAPRGPVYDMVEKHWGKPGAPVLVIWAPAYVMNPVHWTKERVARLRADHPDEARTDVDAKFRDPETSLFTQATVEACTRATPLHLPPDPTRICSAAIDPATRGNGWTLMIAFVEPDGRYRVAYHQEWRGSRDAPLSPKAVLAEMAPVLASYGVFTVHSDQFMADALRDLALEYGIGFSPLAVGEANKIVLYNNIRIRADSGLLELPPDPAIRVDLLNVKKRVTADGVKIVLPQTGDGRHCDWAAVLAMLAGRYLDSRQIVPKPDDGLDPMERQVEAEVKLELEWWDDGAAGIEEYVNESW